MIIIDCVIINHGRVITFCTNIVSGLMNLHEKFDEPTYTIVMGTWIWWKGEFKTMIQVSSEHLSAGGAAHLMHYMRTNFVCLLLFSGVPLQMCMKCLKIIYAVPSAFFAIKLHQHVAIIMISQWAKFGHLQVDGCRIVRVIKQQTHWIGTQLIPSYWMEIITLCQSIKLSCSSRE